MKTAEITKTDKGFYVTLRYGNTNRGRDFFPFKKKGDRKYHGETAANEFAKRWTGE